MNVGEINKGAIMLILVLLVGAGGFLWYQQMYKPAVAERVSALAEKDTAQSSLAQAQSALAAAQQRLEDSKKDASKLDDSVSRVQLARKAVPDKDLIDDAAIVLMDLAEQANIQTSFTKGSNSDGGAAGASDGSLQGATPIDLEFKAGGTYAEMMRFMSLVESTVERRDGKLYTRDRLFNVVSLKMGGEDENAGSGTGGFSEGSSGGGGDEAIVLGPKDMLFTVVVRMYTSSTENAQGVGAEVLAQDPAAGAMTDGAGAPTGTDGAGSSAGTDGTGDQTGAVGGADTGVPAAGGAATGGGM